MELCTQWRFLVSVSERILIFEKIKSPEKSEHLPILFVQIYKSKQMMEIPICIPTIVEYNTLTRLIMPLV